MNYFLEEMTQHVEAKTEFISQVSDDFDEEAFLRKSEKILISWTSILVNTSPLIIPLFWYDNIFVYWALRLSDSISIQTSIIAWTP